MQAVACGTAFRKYEVNLLYVAHRQHQSEQSGDAGSTEEKGTETESLSAAMKNAFRNGARRRRRRTNERNESADT
jgi:hypothetical protein